MLDAVLSRKNASVKTRFTVKSLVSVALIVLAVGLPQLVHLAAGSAGGVKWLPMYLPVLIGGCVLGFKWGLAVGILSPVVSYLVTLGTGNPMPAAVRLPYMIVELAVFAAVSGLFGKRIAKNSWMAFPAVLIAAVAGRVTFIVVAAVFTTVSPLSVQTVWAQVQTGLLGLVLQAVLVPLIVMALSYVLNGKSNEGVGA